MSAHSILILVFFATIFNHSHAGLTFGKKTTDTPVVKKIMPGQSGNSTNIPDVRAPQPTNSAPSPVSYIKQSTKQLINFFNRQSSITSLNQATPSAKKQTISRTPQAPLNLSTAEDTQALQTQPLPSAIGQEKQSVNFEQHKSPELPLGDTSPNQTSWDDLKNFEREAAPLLKELDNRRWHEIDEFSQEADQLLQKQQERLAAQGIQPTPTSNIQPRALSPEERAQEFDRQQQAEKSSAAWDKQFEDELNQMTASFKKPWSATPAQQAAPSQEPDAPRLQESSSQKSLVDEELYKKIQAQNINLIEQEAPAKLSSPTRRPLPPPSRPARPTAQPSPQTSPSPRRIPPPYRPARPARPQSPEGV